MTYDPSKFYVWQATGTQLNIHLSLAVIEELNQRRAELDGDMSAVLLGYSMIAPHRATFVDDFVLLPRAGISGEAPIRRTSRPRVRKS